MGVGWDATSARWFTTQVPGTGFNCYTPKKSFGFLCSWRCCLLTSPLEHLSVIFSPLQKRNLWFLNIITLEKSIICRIEGITCSEAFVFPSKLSCLLVCATCFSIWSHSFLGGYIWRSLFRKRCCLRVEQNFSPSSLLPFELFHLSGRLSIVSCHRWVKRQILSFRQHLLNSYRLTKSWAQYFGGLAHLPDMLIHYK